MDIQPGQWIESENYYKFPGKQVAKCDKDTAWLMGLIIGDGCCDDTDGRISLTVTDKDIANYVIKQYGFHIAKQDEHHDLRQGWCHGKTCRLNKNDKSTRDLLLELGLGYHKHTDQKIPWSILMSPRHIVMEFLKGLYNGNGSCLLFTDARGYKRFRILCCSMSEQLCREVQDILYKLGYVSCLQYRIHNPSPKKQWVLEVNGDSAIELGLLLGIKRMQSKIKQADRRQKKNYITKGKDGYNVKYICAGKKVGRWFKHREDAEKHVEHLRRTTKHYRKVKRITKLDHKIELFDFTLPKTHSFYANGVRNHNSIDSAIFETVVTGFAAVSGSPIHNIEYHNKLKYLLSMGMQDAAKELMDSYTVHRNQIILAGTSGYQFQPMYRDFDKYRKFIEFGHDVKKLKQVMPDFDPPVTFDPKDYCICRIPYALIREHAQGFMDDAIIDKAKATMDIDRYNNEYETVFTADSAGFFKASVINANTIHYVVGKHGDAIGENGCLGYLFGIDVASERDLFAIAVIGVYADHAKVANVWTTNRKAFEERRKLHLTEMSEYYSFCVRKLRELVEAYPPMTSHPMGAYIACDVGGGGVAVREALHDKDKIRYGERCIYEIVDPDKQKQSDVMEGDHCLYMVNFTNKEVRNELYYVNNKLMQDGRIKFPAWDTIAIEEALEDESEDTRMQYLEKCANETALYDTIEDTYTEIQKTADELVSIKLVRTGATERFELPKTRDESTGLAKSSHADRAVSLLLAMLLYNRYLQTVSLQTPAEQLSASDPRSRNKQSMWVPTSTGAMMANRMASALNKVNAALSR